MESKRVNSGKIRSGGYDPKSQVLEIEFSDGKIVQYRGVSPQVHRQFTAAPSPTSFFQDNIDAIFPSSRMNEPTHATPRFHATPVSLTGSKADYTHVAA